VAADPAITIRRVAEELPDVIGLHGPLAPGA
jgi:hypothetical protein